MAVEQVTVIQAGPAVARIHARTRHHCTQCALKSGCGHHLLAGAFPQRRDAQFISLPLGESMQGQVAAGDILTLAINENSLVRLAVLQYLVPLLCMLAGTAVASNLIAATGAGEGWVILAATCALGLGLVWVGKAAANLDLSARLSCTRPIAGNPAFKTTN